MIDMDISSFATLHGLDKEAVDLLETCTEHILGEVFATFHSENSNNPSARLSSFVKKMTVGQKFGRSSRLLTRLESFIAQWNLDAAAQDNLSSAAPEVQDHVISRFSPDGATKNINAALMSFVKLAKIKVEEDAQTMTRRSSVTVGTAVPRRVCLEPHFPLHDSIDTVAVANFIRRHDLDSKASAILIELPCSVRDSVLVSFNPSGGADISKLFTAFALSRWKGSKKTAPERRRERVPSPIISRKRGRQDVDDFIDKFGLDATSVSTLENLPKDVARSVMADFRPPLNTENVNKLFVSFARSQGRAGDRPGHERRTMTVVEAWADEQGLDDKAKDLLYSLSSDTQTSVMRAFMPEVGGNVNKIFMSFVNNMARRH